MPIAKHHIDYNKKLFHYRGGQYPIRRVTAYRKEDGPEFKAPSLVSTADLNHILYDDTHSRIREVKEAGDLADKVVGFFLEAELFVSPIEVIREVLEKKNPEWVFTNVS